MRDGGQGRSSWFWPVLLGVGLVPVEAWACAVCFGGTGADRGYYWSWLLLTALPFAVVAVIGAWVARAARKARGGEKATTASGLREGCDS